MECELRLVAKLTPKMIDIFGDPTMAKTNVKVMLFELVSKTSKSEVFALVKQNSTKYRI